MPEKPVFFDMLHSNNAARVRLFIGFKGLDDKIEQKMIVYADLQDPEYQKLNPMKKVPAMILEDGSTLFESNVILEYLRDRFSDVEPNFDLKTPEARAEVNLLMRIHDLYIASPNCTQPNFAHTQGAMYLPPFETKFSAASRAMDRPTRAAKLAELWKHMTWLETRCKGPYLTGESITLADMTWMPTCVFMEFMLPRTFDWPDFLNDESKGFPNLAKWYKFIQAEHELVKKVHDQIWGFWVTKEEAGQFETIKFETQDPAFKWKYP